MTTGKTIALTRQTFVGKVRSLLLNMLSRLVITFLPRSKRLLISWLQSPSAVILEPQKPKVWHCFHGFSRGRSGGLASPYLSEFSTGLPPMNFFLFPLFYIKDNSKSWEDLILSHYLEPVSQSVLLTFETREFFIVEAVLWHEPIVGCLAAPLTSTHKMPAASCPLLTAPDLPCPCRLTLPPLLWLCPPLHTPPPLFPQCGI